jgi:hypothetical protein
MYYKDFCQKSKAAAGAIPLGCGKCRCHNVANRRRRFAHNQPRRLLEKSPRLRYTYQTEKPENRLLPKTRGLSACGLENPPPEG